MIPESPSIIPNRSPVYASPRNRIGLASLTSLIYLLVSGGAYGIEDAVGIAGPRLTFLLCGIIPFTLSLPVALMTSELMALMPVEGGFYFWVKTALGPFAGFIEAYVTLLFTAVDTAIYPVLFSAYLAFLMRVGRGGQVVLALGLIWSAGLLNLAGMRMVATTSVAFTVALIAPIAAMVVFGFPQLIASHASPAARAPAEMLGALGGGLSVVMWNFSGWENISVIAGEMPAAGRNYLRAIKIALPAVALGYLLPLAVTLPGTAAPAQWRTGWLAVEGARIGGPLLGAAISIGGAVSAAAMFSAALLWVSRLPFVLAGEGYLPRGLGRIWAERQVPAHSIVVCCIVLSLLLPLSFMTLIELDVFFYMLALVLEMWALVRLRRLRPNREGLFVIGRGWPALWTVVAAPIATWIVSLGFILKSGGLWELIAAIVLCGCGWPLYFLLSRHYGAESDSARRCR